MATLRNKEVMATLTYIEHKNEVPRSHIFPIIAHLRPLWLPLTASEINFWVTGYAATL